MTTCGGSSLGDCTLQAACTPSNPQPTPWVNPQGAVILMKMTRRSPFQEGGWVPPRQPSPTQALAQPDGGWVPEGPPPQPLRPAPAN